MGAIFVYIKTIANITQKPTYEVGFWVVPRQNKLVLKAKWVAAILHHGARQCKPNSAHFANELSAQLS